jgi:hypothetical protein
MANGVNWGAYLEQTTSKVKGFIQSLQFRKKTWNFQARITIYKTFIRPVGKYCLPLVSNWIKLEPKTRSKYSAMLEETHKLALEWIFDLNRPKILLEYISGLSLERRLTQLEGSLSRHLEGLDKSNPLIKHFQTNFLSTGNNFILGKCFKNAEYRKWKKTRNDDQVEMTWETCCKQ